MEFLRQPRTQIAIGLLVFICLIIVVVLNVFSGDKSGQYYDKPSGETVSDPSWKTKDNYATNDNQPIYLGFSTLLDYGMTQNQMTGVRYAFYQFAKKQNPPIKEVSIYVKEIQQITENGNQYLEFKVRTDRKTDYRARIEYTGLNAITLHLYDIKTNKEVFNSGSLNLPGVTEN